MKDAERRVRLSLARSYKTISGVCKLHFFSTRAATSASYRSTSVSEEATTLLGTATWPMV
jgi:hypothetical protein